MPELRSEVVCTSDKHVVSLVDQSTTIFPEDKYGKQMYIRKPKHSLLVRCLRSGDVVMFSTYYANHQWFFRDSRSGNHGKPIHRRVLVAELARMLGPIDGAKVLSSLDNSVIETAAKRGRRTNYLLFT